MSPKAPQAGDERRPPERREGAGPADADSPEFSRGQPLDDPQPSVRRREDLENGAPREHAGPRPGQSMRKRASIHSLLEGVPLPATRSDLIKHARREGGRSAAKILRALPSQRFGTLDEVGEMLEPVQPTWPHERRVPKAESGLPPGGSAYGISPSEDGAGPR